MCGIAGIINPVEASFCGRELAAMGRALRHRGPDDHGFLRWSPREEAVVGRSIEPGAAFRVGFAHQRLSILDLTESGWQPMSTEDGRFHLVFNGEIYNYVELREQLLQAGHRFRSDGDTEVLLRALASWGVGALPRLIGMFALALLDVREQRLLLARDFFGIKPLYYSSVGGALVFASEHKAIRTVPGFEARANHARVYDYLFTAMVDHSPETMFEGVFQLPPAHYMLVPIGRDASLTPQRYWQVDAADKLDVGFEEAAAHTRELFLSSVRLHQRSDVPVSAAVSGGIDSSAIVMSMHALASGDLNLHAFGYVASDEASSEEKWIDHITTASGVICHKVSADPHELVKDLTRLIEVQEEPFGGTSIYAQYRVFEAVRREGIKVMVDGQGADEMFAGYMIYLPVMLAALVRRRRLGAAMKFYQSSLRWSGSDALTMLKQAGFYALPASLRPRVLQWARPRWLRSDWLGRVVEEDGYHWCPDGRSLTEILYDEMMRYRLPHLLRYEDRNSMHHSVESRVPFLHPELVEFVLRLPDEYLLGTDATSKRVLRTALQGLVPQAILERRDKVGFATPERRWFGELRSWVEDVLAGETAQSMGVLDLSAARADFHAMLAGRRAFDFRFWRWVNLVRWAETFNVSFS